MYTTGHPPVLLWSGASAPTYQWGCMMPRQWSSTTKCMLVGGSREIVQQTPMSIHLRPHQGHMGHSPSTTTISCYWWEDGRPSTDQTTNQLWVFEEGEQTWIQPLPPMPTANQTLPFTVTSSLCSAWCVGKPNNFFLCFRSPTNM